MRGFYFTLFLSAIPLLLSAQDTKTFYYNAGGVEVDSTGNYSTFEFCEINDSETKDGKCDVFTKTDKLIETYHYTEGVKNGKYYRYFPQQTPMITGQYSTGNKDGAWVTYDSKGTPKMLYNYEEDSIVSQHQWEALSKEERVEVPIIKPLPTFIGDQNAFVKFLASQLRYPREAKRRGVQGRVLVSFWVDKTGQVGEIEIQSSPSDILSDEVIRLIELSPKWEPANMNGENIGAWLSFAITFQLKDELWLLEQKN